MKTEQPILITSVTAEGEQGHTIPKNILVGFDGSELGNLEKQLGVCNADTLVSQQMPVMVAGIALVLSYSTVTKGSKVECGDEGKVRNWTTGEVVGYALDSATGENEPVRVLLT